MAAGLQEYEDEACHHRHGDEQQWADPVQPAEPCVSQCVVISALWCIGHAGGYLTPLEQGESRAKAHASQRLGMRRFTIFDLRFTIRKLAAYVDMLVNEC